MQIFPMERMPPKITRPVTKAAAMPTRWGERPHVEEVVWVRELDCVVQPTPKAAHTVQKA